MGASFRISQVMVCEMFMSFKCQMYVDNDVLVEGLLLEKEILWAYILCFKAPSIAPMYCLTELLVFTEALYTIFFEGCYFVGGKVLYPYSCIIC